MKDCPTCERYNASITHYTGFVTQKTALNHRYITIPMYYKNGVVIRNKKGCTSAAIEIRNYDTIQNSLD